MDAADELWHVLRVARVLPLEERRREHVFAPPRKWRFDIALLPERRVLRIGIEVDGGTWTAGRHVRGQGFENDCRKLNAAARDGWTVLRFTPAMVRSGEALRVIESCLTGSR